MLNNLKSLSTKYDVSVQRSQSGLTGTQTTNQKLTAMSRSPQAGMTKVTNESQEFHVASFNLNNAHNIKAQRHFIL